MVTVQNSPARQQAQQQTQKPQQGSKRSPALNKSGNGQTPRGNKAAKKHPQAQQLTPQQNGNGGKKRIHQSQSSPALANGGMQFTPKSQHSRFVRCSSCFFSLTFPLSIATETLPVPDL